MHRSERLQGSVLRRSPIKSTTSEKERAEAMGFFSKDIKTMDDLFVHTLRDIYLIAPMRRCFSATA
jgi:hypothetical protein